MVRKADVDLAILAGIAVQIMGKTVLCTIERTEEGTSTQVYRLRRGGEVFYLRIAETRDAGLGPEVQVHQLLHQRGCLVPQVIHFEPFDERLERSIMVTTAIAGEPLALRTPDASTLEILRSAGRDLAALNALPVQGFGWIRRESAVAGILAAEKPSFRGFILEHIAADLTRLTGVALTTTEIAAMRRILQHHDPWLDVDQARLAHGDLDVTHIYHQHGRYTGIIDFGEIRGADRLYDLAHFHLHDGERIPQRLLPALLAGYAEAAPLPPQHAERIALISLLIGIRALARTLDRDFLAAYRQQLIAAIRGVVAEFG